MNYGYVKPEFEPGHYVLGGLPKVILREDGNWSDFVPVYEPQFGADWDSYGCSVWGTLNAMETLLKSLEGKEYNFSERFNYILARVRKPGASPHYVAEVIRKNGVIDDKLLPMTRTYEEFLSPDPMEAKYLVEGLKFPYNLKHEWLWNDDLPLSEKNARITEALKYSPVCISVTAWYEENGIYVDNGLPNSHWCVCIQKTLKGWKVFDSYDQSIKIVSFDHHIDIAKRYFLEDKGGKDWRYTVPLLKQLMNLLDTLAEWAKKTQLIYHEGTIRKTN